jgi:hypothetical protein
MTSNSIHFEKLTPIDSAKIDTYAEALDFAFANGEGSALKCC